jgi:hypothetical protein
MAQQGQVFPLAVRGLLKPVAVDDSDEPDPVLRADLDIRDLTGPGARSRGRR